MRLKSAPTVLCERAMAKQDAPTEGFRAWREAAQDQLPETVIDACVFSRPTSYAADKAAQQFGLFGRFVKQQTQKALAGDLPRHFVLAVTAEDVVVLERRMGTTHGAMGQPGPEVARWRRATLNVTWKDGGYVYDASITAPDATDRHRCCVGKMPLSEDFLRLLTDPARMTPAA